MKLTILVNIWEEEGNNTTKFSSFAKSPEEAIAFIEKYWRENPRQGAETPQTVDQIFGVGDEKQTNNE